MSCDLPFAVREIIREFGEAAFFAAAARGFAPEQAVRAQAREMEMWARWVIVSGSEIRLRGAFALIFGTETPAELWRVDLGAWSADQWQKAAELANVSGWEVEFHSVPDEPLAAAGRVRLWAILEKGGKAMAITADEARALADRGGGRAASGPAFERVMETVWNRIRAVAAEGGLGFPLRMEGPAQAAEAVARLTAAGFGAVIGAATSGGAVVVSVSWNRGQAAPVAPN